ncbi:Peptidase inhibitor I78 family protein [Paracoccus isoporae]|uniref:Peptidase inhibitor I78 family protein n=1 Tax=Paracoccus isoporae TaxID=591205 RepID=A0A1G6WA91_9RHOB|nr:I78 family peptidase inhibitor [Paracoccus isoporae]SDD62782.1 Peptidase inhibitor I78 family protein [Paracoccus isoporae]
MRKLALILPVAAMLSACAPPAPGSGLPDRCGPEYDMLPGRNVGEFTFPPGLPHRVIQPGAMVTQDYSPARLNVYVDDKGFIERVSCG